MLLIWCEAFFFIFIIVRAHALKQKYKIDFFTSEKLVPI